MAGASAFGGWKHRAAQFYVLILLFSFPIFSFPCQKGLCSSPLEIVALNLLEIGIDESLVKGLLYPAAVFSKIEAVAVDTEPFALPDWGNLLLDLNMTQSNLGLSPETGFVVGNYFCVIGALLSAFGIMWLSACGMLTLLWFIYTLGGAGTDVFALPMFAIALLCAIGNLLNLGSFAQRREGSSTPSHVSAALKNCQKLKDHKTIKAKGYHYSTEQKSLEVLKALMKV